MNQPLIDASSKGEEELTINVDHNSSGLTSQRAAQLLEQYGYNELQEEITNPIIEFLKKKLSTIKYRFFSSKKKLINIF